MMTRTRWTALFTALLLVGLMGTAQAQTVRAPGVVEEEVPMVEAPTWRANFGKQTAIQLRSKIPAVREQALVNIITVANQDRGVDLRPVLSSLERTYERDRNEGHRMMALVALHAISDEGSMQYLAEQTRYWERSERVHRLVRAILADYYGA